MKPPTLPALADALVHLGRPAMLDGRFGRPWSLDSCIAATRLTVDVARGCGYTARPLPVKLYAINAPAAELVETGEPLDAKKFKRTGGWIVECGFTGDRLGPRPDRYDGHLVAVVANRLLVDLSADQASRPQYAMALEPMAWEPPKADVMGLIKGEPLSTRQGRIALIYEPHPDDKGYLRSPDWTNPVRRKPITRALLRELGR